MSILEALRPYFTAPHRRRAALRDQVFDPGCWVHTDQGSTLLAHYQGPLPSGIPFGTPVENADSVVIEAGLYSAPYTTTPALHIWKLDHDGQRVLRIWLLGTRPLEDIDTGLLGFARYQPGQHEIGDALIAVQDALRQHGLEPEVPSNKIFVADDYIFFGRGWIGCFGFVYCRARKQVVRLGSSMFPWAIHVWAMRRGVREAVAIHLDRVDHLEDALVALRHASADPSPRLARRLADAVELDRWPVVVPLREGAHLHAGALYAAERNNVWSATYSAAPS